MVFALDILSKCCQIIAFVQNISEQYKVNKKSKDKYFVCTDNCFNNEYLLQKIKICIFFDVRIRELKQI